MRILYSLLFFCLTTVLSGQCISVQIDTVFCNPNGGYSVTFDVEGTGDSLWQLVTDNGIFVVGGYDTDELFTAGPFFGEVTGLFWSDQSDPDCTFSEFVSGPDDCNVTDPCFGFFVGTRVPDNTAIGSMEIFVDGGVSPYNYALGDGNGNPVRPDTLTDATSVQYADLAPGTYFSHVTDARGCEVFNQFTIVGDEDCAVSVIVENVSCSGDQNGTAAATAFGTAPFTFQWSTGATTELITDLAPGVYTVTITDADGCTSTGTGAVQNPRALTLQVEEFGGICDTILNDVHFLSASVTGGTPPYLYEYSLNGEVLCQELSCGDIQGGETYTVIVTDANGCSVSQDYAVSFGSTSINWFTPFYLGCEGEPVTIAVNDDGSDFTFTWTGPDGFTATGTEIEASVVGNYTVSGTSPTNDCSINGVATVLPRSVIDLELGVELLDSMACGLERCMYITAEGGIWNQNFTITWYDPAGNAIESSQGGFVCVEGDGLYAAEISNDCDTVTITQWLEANPECSTLNGTVYVDAAGNCSLDAGDDIPAPGILVEINATDGSSTYYTITDEDGIYGQEVVVGEYTIRPVTQPTQPFGVCDPLPIAVVSAGSPTTVDAFLPTIVNCPLLVTDVSIPFLRRCFSTNVFVEYGNIGSATAENAQLTVTFDAFLEDIVPSIPASSIDGQAYTFDLGDLPPFADGRIFFSVKVSCEATLGQSHCIAADITPNEPCVSPDDWEGAVVNVTPGSCNGDSLSFDISNVGDNAMTVPLSYIVIEDGIMMTPEPVEIEQLEAGEVFTIDLPAAGVTYHIVTNQEPNAPVTNTPAAMLEGCVNVPGGAFSTGFANILALGNGGPNGSIACRENRGAYDPNDKNGYPLGYGVENNIAPGTRLDYAIRFQNTGTDTAFTVVISDTIGEALDLSTFKAGASSHDYTVSIDTNRVVTFAFANIMLPDSNVNLAASQGVVNFKIDHVAELAPGDYITNEAAIYFDFNEPVITNVSTHRIEVEGLPTGVRGTLARSVNFQVYPNPGNGLLQLSVPNRDIRATDVLTVVDLYGRPVATTTYGRLGDAWNVSHLPAGYYLLVVSERDGLAKGRTGFVKR